MTTLTQWRKIIAKQVAAGLSTDTTTFAAYQTPHQGIDFPAVVVWPGGIEDYIEVDPDADPTLTWCSQPVNTTIGIVAGQPQESAYDLLDECLELLPAALELCATDEWWSPYDVVPWITRVPAYSLAEFGGVQALVAPVQVTGIRQSHNHQ